MIVCRSPFVAEREKEERIIVHRENERKKEATERMREKKKATERKKEAIVTKRTREWEGKKKEAAERMREKKRIMEERERIDNIRSCSNILVQEIGLLMYSSSLDLMSYCSLAKKKRVLASLLEAWIVDILRVFFLYFTYASAVGDALTRLKKPKKQKQIDSWLCFFGFFRRVTWDELN